MAKIIKGGSGKKVSAEALRADACLPEDGVMHKRVMDAKEQAAKIVAKAEKDAEKIRNEAVAILEDSKKKRDEAIKKGYAEGESKGLAQVTEKLIRLGTLRESFYANAESDVIKLVIDIAEKVIGRFALENRETIKSVIHLALEKALGDRITIRLNPEDYKNIMSGDKEFHDLVDRTKRLMFREDDGITRGGCIVETEVGTIDARMETQMDAIRKALLS